MTSYPVATWKERYDNGDSLNLIANEYGISRQRVHQLIKKHEKVMQAEKTRTRNRIMSQVQEALKARNERISGDRVQRWIERAGFNSIDELDGTALLSLLKAIKKREETD